MRRHQGLLLLVLILAACTSSRIHKPVAEPARPERVTTPRCLNIQDGDRHVELHQSSLWLAETGKPRELKVDSNVFCERLEILKTARHPTVLLEYTDAKGARKLAVASIQTATWIVKPTVLESAKHEPQTQAVWSLDPKDGKVILTLTNKISSKTYHP